MDSSEGQPARSSKAKRGRPATLSRGQIVEAALVIGFDRLTVAAVAGQLGVRHTSLYTHIAGYEDLCASALDRVLSEVLWPEPDLDWRSFLEAEAAIIWATFDQHAGMYEVLRKTRAYPSTVVDRFGKGLSHLVSCGFTPSDAVLLLESLYHLASEGPDQARSESAKAPGVEPWVEGLDVQLATSLGDSFGRSPYGWMSQKLALLFDGAEFRLHSSRRS